MKSAIAPRVPILQYSFQCWSPLPLQQSQLQQQKQHQLSKQFSTLRARRKKPKFEYSTEEENIVDHETPEIYFTETPYRMGSGNSEDDLEEYFKKASLSPWAPLPESSYRRFFDLIEVQPDDIHVDLGCGDGRINFHAADRVGVAKSIGVDVDAEILKRAHERLARRHPPPKNLEFHEADLMDEFHPVWEKVQEATIITMFFTHTALQKFRPILERKMFGRKCQIFTAGYAMPDWNPHITEVVAGTKIHLYKWGEANQEAEIAHLFGGLSEEEIRAKEHYTLHGEKEIVVDGHTVVERSEEEQQQIMEQFWDNEDKELSALDFADEEPENKNSKKKKTKGKNTKTTSKDEKSKSSPVVELWNQTKSD